MELSKIAVCLSFTVRLARSISIADMKVQASTAVQPALRSAVAWFLPWVVVFFL